MTIRELTQSRAGLTADRPGTPYQDVVYFDESTGEILKGDGTKWMTFTGVNAINVKNFGAVGDGTTEDTAAIVAALAAGALAGAPIYFPPGTYLTDKITAPANFAGMVGAGRRVTTLKFKRYAYTAFSVMIAVNATGQPFVLSGFHMDMDDAVFQAASSQGINIQNCSDIDITGLSITSRGEYCAVLGGISRGRVDDLKMAGGVGCRVGVYAVGGINNTKDLTVDRCSMTGTFEYAVVFGATCEHSRMRNCRSEGGVGGFAFSLADCLFSYIEGCFSKNSSHEAFQITDCDYCTILGCHGEWENGFGQDMGISINGDVSARFNKVLGCTLINSFGAGIGVANFTQYSLIANNQLRNCGTRGTAAGSGGSNICAIVGYTDAPGALCNNNKFTKNEVITESGTVTYGYGEFQTGGGGATVDGNIIEDNRIVGAGTKLLLVGPSTRIADHDVVAFTPTVSAAVGTITTAAASLNYVRRGRLVRFHVTVTITNNGTGAGAVLVTLPFSAVSGVIFGRADAVSGKALQGICSGTTLTITNYDNSYPGASGEVLRLTGEMLIS